MHTNTKKKQFATYTDGQPIKKKMTIKKNKASSVKFDLDSKK